MKTRKHLSMILIILSVLLFYSGTTRTIGFYVVKEKWVARYNGTANGYDGAYAIATDTSGNVYVTGHCDGYGFPSAADYATIKYDADGNELWVAKYNGPGDGADMAYDITVDTSGNVYVTGGSVGQDMWGNLDYATIKYDSNGNKVWVSRYDGPQHGRDNANVIVLDELGNVYVAGNSMTSATVENWAYAVVKYDPNGNQLWAARYTGPSSESDILTDMALDGFGNVYVTGRNRALGYATIKYDPNGNELWEARWGTNWAYAEAIAVDSEGFVYVTGFDGLGSAADYATIKYDPNGNELWVTKYNGPDSDWDFGQDIALDKFGNIYVTGYCDGQDTDSKYATVKYNPNGNELWTAIYSGPNDVGNRAFAITVDSLGNAYVTGYVHSWTWEEEHTYSYATIKYNSNGNEVWMAKYDGPANKSRASAIAVDNSHNVYVTGESAGSDTNYDYATIKYASPFCSIPIKGDLNDDCKVNLKDSAILASQWRQAPGVPSADIAPTGGDGMVDWLDLGVLVNNWLWE